MGKPTGPAGPVDLQAKELGPGDMSLGILTDGALHVFQRLLKGFKIKGGSNLTAFAKERFPPVCLNYCFISSHYHLLFLFDILISFILVL